MTVAEFSDKFNVPVSGESPVWTGLKLLFYRPIALANFTHCTTARTLLHRKLMYYCKTSVYRMTLV